MKRIFFLALVLAAAMTANAQFTIFYGGQNLAENSEVTIMSNGDEAVFQPVIINTMTRPVTAKIRVLKTNSTNISVSAICTDVCVTSSLSGPFVISANGTYADAHVDFDVPANATTGMFKFIVMDNDDTTIRNSVNLKVMPNGGVSVVEASSECLLKAYPNPASEKVSIVYSLPESDGQAVLTVYSLKGNVVSETPIVGGEGSVTLDVSSLPAGIYIYGIKSSAGKAAMRKLIVK